MLTNATASQKSARQLRQALGIHKLKLYGKKYCQYKISIKKKITWRIGRIICLESVS